MARTVLIVALALFACLLAADARKLFAPTGTVEVVTAKVYTDPNGGIAPFSERYAAAKALWEPRQKLIEVEAECKRNKDEECEKLKELKEEQAAAAKEKEEEDAAAKAEEEGEEAEEEEEEVIVAPCRTSVFLNYFIGTTCLPDKPLDIKPAPEEEEEPKDRRR